MVENLWFTNRREGRNKNQREDASPVSRFLAATSCSNCAYHSYLHLQIITHLPLKTKRGKTTINGGDDPRRSWRASQHP